MNIRCLLTAILAVTLLVGSVSAHADDNEKKGQTGDKTAAAPKLTPAQQRPVLQLLRERELINARIEGAVMALIAFFGLSPSEWDVVTDGDGVSLARRKPPAPTPAPQGENR